jgi:hypothetical protein
MLSTFDDYPVHQVLEPLRIPGTTDRNFYDRYYFNLHTCSEELIMAAGLGCYPNRGVVDAFVAVLCDGTHSVVRASRTLGADRADTCVGPLSVEVIEGLKTLRLRCDPRLDASDIRLDLTWTGVVAAHKEPRHTHKCNGRTVMDMCRFTQTGTWHGSITVGDRTFDVSPTTCWGVRDRSWGIRPIGEPEPAGIDAGPPPGHFWNWAPMQFADKTILYSAQEDSAGRRTVDQAMVLYTDPDRDDEDLGTTEHTWRFTPGTRQISGGVLRFPHAVGDLREVMVEPLVPMVLSLGTGYGGEVAPQEGLGEWRHGMYQGELVVQSASWEMNTIPVANLLNATVDHVSRFTTNSGDVGYGIVNYVIAGPNERYGFTGFTDGAQ